MSLAWSYVWSLAQGGMSESERGVSWSKEAKEKLVSEAWRVLGEVGELAVSRAKSDGVKTVSVGHVAAVLQELGLPVALEGDALFSKGSVMAGLASKCEAKPRFEANAWAQASKRVEALIMFAGPRAVRFATRAGEKRVQAESVVNAFDWGVAEPSATPTLQEGVVGVSANVSGDAEAWKRAASCGPWCAVCHPELAGKAPRTNWVKGEAR